MATTQKRPAEAMSPTAVKRIRIAADEGVGDSADSGVFTGPSTPRVPTTADALSTAATAITARSSSKRPKKYVCEVEGCDKAFDRPVRLQDHQRTHTGDRPHVCDEPDCDKAFFKIEHLKAHVQNKHSAEAAFVCDYMVSVGGDGEGFECGKAFTTSTRLRRHLAAHQQKEHLRCQEPGCDLVFRKLETLQRHIKQAHLGEKAFRCTQMVFDADATAPDECGLEFATVGQLKAHETREHAGLKHFCDICSARPAVGSADDDISMFEEPAPAGFQTYAELQIHMKTAHPPTCAICGHVCESKRALAAHTDIEHSSLSERQKFPCTHPGCGRSFTRQGNLKVHVQNVHIQHKRFVCGHFDLAGNDKCPGFDGHGCGMAFGTKANLENHTRTQHLRLPSLLKRRVAVKAEDDGDDAGWHGRRPGGEDDESAALTLLTGCGYDAGRPLACWAADCPVRFVREFDLAQHMELAHSWLVDDINERLAEDEALAGGRFWVGGDAVVGSDSTALDPALALLGAAG